jgi:3-phosphoshikimate 1-carboxyvinyltransferase
MAMSFASLALSCNKIEIENPSVVEKSFPHFWEQLKKIGFSIT